MAVLDGDPVERGDLVFDVVYGAGQVVEVLPQGRFRVRFGRRTYTYDENGMRSEWDFRTLYWHDPVIYVPPKAAAKWDRLKRLVAAIKPEVDAWP